MFLRNVQITLAHIQPAVKGKGCLTAKELKKDKMDIKEIGKHQKLQPRSFISSSIKSRCFMFKSRQTETK